jgi:hypothetical protein
MKSINVLAITKSDLPDCTKSTHTGLVLEERYCIVKLHYLHEVNTPPTAVVIADCDVADIPVASIRIPILNFNELPNFSKKLGFQHKLI